MSDRVPPDVAAGPGRLPLRVFAAARRDACEVPDRIRVRTEHRDRFVWVCSDGEEAGAPEARRMTATAFGRYAGNPSFPCWIYALGETGFVDPFPLH
jgi:hypothetical protein